MRIQGKQKPQETEMRFGDLKDGDVFVLSAERDTDSYVWIRLCPATAADLNDGQVLPMQPDTVICPRYGAVVVLYPDD